jgi:structural maintenance of chromosome 4
MTRHCFTTPPPRPLVQEEGGDAYEEVPNTSLVITRTAHGNNTSKYLLGDRAVPFKEIQTLLTNRGIDLDHNRFLILQGEVESIAMLKPKAPSEHEDGLLEYLEDIIGSNR